MIQSLRNAQELRASLITCRRCGLPETRHRSPFGGVSRSRHLFKARSLRPGDFARDCEAWLRESYAMSRAHSREAGEAEKAFGDRGPLISGCVRDHFPESVKDYLRDLALACGEWSRLSFDVWLLSGRRRATWLSLKERVIAEDGRGFYG